MLSSVKIKSNTSNKITKRSTIATRDIKSVSDLSFFRKIDEAITSKKLIPVDEKFWLSKIKNVYAK